MDELYCRRCGNTTQFKKTSKGYYCEACKQFGRYYVDTPATVREWHLSEVDNNEYTLSYELSKKQQQCAKEIIEGVRNKENVLVYAACGAGKTEMVMPLITYCFENHLKVGMAIPRKEVVVELQQRFKDSYKNKEIVAVYGGHHEEIDGDFIICTTHQLFRYEKTFDVLIVDEVDAFPFAGNKVLEGMVEFAHTGCKVLLTATPSDDLLTRANKGEMRLVTLFERYHQGKLCIPKVIVGYEWYLYLKLFYFLKQHRNKTTLLFVPSIQMANRFGKVLQCFSNKVLVLTSQSKDREIANKEMKEHKYQIIVCTTVMERGITISDVQVMVYQADHSVFTLASLIQIAGRVGRKEEAKEGECLFLCGKKSEIVEQAISRLKEMNQNG